MTEKRTMSVEEMASALYEVVDQADPEATKYTAKEGFKIAEKAAHSLMDKAFHAEPSEDNKKKFEFYRGVAAELRRKINLLED